MDDRFEVSYRKLTSCTAAASIKASGKQSPNAVIDPTCSLQYGCQHVAGITFILCLCLLISAVANMVSCFSDYIHNVYNLSSVTSQSGVAS